MLELLPRTMLPPSLLMLELSPNTLLPEPLLMDTELPIAVLPELLLMLELFSASRIAPEDPEIDA